LEGTQIRIKFRENEVQMGGARTRGDECQDITYSEEPGE